MSCRVVVLNTALAAGTAPKPAVAAAMYGVETAVVMGEKSLEWAVKHPRGMRVLEGIADMRSGTTPVTGIGVIGSTFERARELLNE